MPPGPWIKELPQLVAPAQHTQSIKHDPHPCSGTTDCPVLPCTVPVPLPPLHTIITEQEAEMQMASTPWRRCAGKKFFILSLEKKKKGFFLMMSLTSTATSSVVTSWSQTSLTRSSGRRSWRGDGYCYSPTSSWTPLGLFQPPLGLFQPPLDPCLLTLNSACTNVPCPGRTCCQHTECEHYWENKQLEVWLPG